MIQNLENEILERLVKNLYLCYYIKKNLYKKTNYIIFFSLYYSI